MSHLSRAPAIDVIPSSTPIINKVTGIGGFPRGRVTEIFGPESTGKTTIAIEVIAECQRLMPESVCAYFDFDHAFDPSYARNLGLKIDDPARFIFVQPDYFEQGDKILDSFLNKGALDLAIIDSAPAMTPKVDLEGAVHKFGRRADLQAPLMSRFLTRIKKKLSRGRGCALIVLNQTRMKSNFQNRGVATEDAAGGKALRICSSLRLRLEMVKCDRDMRGLNQGAVGIEHVCTSNHVRVTAAKNKLASPFRHCTFVIAIGHGIDNVASIADLAEVILGIGSGDALFHYEGDTPETTFSCVGREAFVDKLRADQATFEEITRRVLDKL